MQDLRTPRAPGRGGFVFFGDRFLRDRKEGPVKPMKLMALIAVVALAVPLASAADTKHKINLGESDSG